MASMDDLIASLGGRALANSRPDTGRAHASSRFDTSNDPPRMAAGAGDFKSSSNNNPTNPAAASGNSSNKPAQSKPSKKTPSSAQQHTPMWNKTVKEAMGLTIPDKRKTPFHQAVLTLYNFIAEVAGTDRIQDKKTHSNYWKRIDSYWLTKPNDYNEAEFDQWKEWIIGVKKDRDINHNLDDLEDWYEQWLTYPARAGISEALFKVRSCQNPNTKDLTLGEILGRKGILRSAFVLLVSVAMQSTSNPRAMAGVTKRAIQSVDNKDLAAFRVFQDAYFDEIDGMWKRGNPNEASSSSS
jgi:hypothetical protein